MTKEEDRSSRFIEASSRMTAAWEKMVKTGQDSTYLEVRGGEFDQLREEALNDNPPREEIKHIAAYLRALNDLHVSVEKT